MSEPQIGDTSAKENQVADVVVKEKSAEEDAAAPIEGSEITQSQKDQIHNEVGHGQHHHNRTFYNQKQFVGQRQHHQQNTRNGQTAWNTKRHDFADRRMRSQTTNQYGSGSSAKGWVSSEKPGQLDKKTRSLSTTASNQPGNNETEKLNKKRGSRSQQQGKSATDLRTSSNNSMSNAESIDFEETELDEPFSESEDEFAARKRASQKPSLAIPRGRIRSLSGTIPPVGYSPHWGGPTMCFSCLQFFQLPEMLDDFSAHLLNEHKIVVEGINIIVDLKRYVEHWRQQFSKNSIDKIFPKKVPEEGNPLFGKVDYYFEMTESVKEDYALRQRLAMRRLEEALACQQREREDCTFAMQCIFCRYMARGNRAKIIHHLYTIHHLNLGSPDNLVFVAEYIAHLGEKINRNECIYCEKTFSDRNTLMDHMRKKNHKEVNPKNNYYDKFYIINYLELGKRWLDVLAEDFEDTMPTFVDSDEEEEEETWHEWQEDNTGEEDILAVCLFCDHGGETLDDIAKHMKENHKFDLIEHIRDQKMDTYDRMKFLNFLRKRTFNTRSGPGSENKFAEIPERDEWDKEENLVPMFGNVTFLADHLLWFLESWFLEQEAIDGAEGGEKQKETTSVELGILVEESKKNTVSGVVAEDLPDLTDSCLDNSESQEF